MAPMVKFHLTKAKFFGFSEIVLEGSNRFKKRVGLKRG
jgi:hypothetical protein